MAGTGSRGDSIDDIARSMLAVLTDPVFDDLRHEDIATAIEVHFQPVRLLALPSLAGYRSECSTDGFYDASTGRVPTILYADDGAPARTRFTLVHELGHHLLATTCVELLDPIDVVAGRRRTPTQVEESVCHRFAGLVLVPDDVVGAVIGDDRLQPRHVIEIHDSTHASWDAVAVRTAGLCDYKAAVVILRDKGVVSFCATSTRLGPVWWPQGSRAAPGGALELAAHTDQRARPDVYRHGLGGQENLFCDTTRAGPVTVAVLSDRPSDGHFEILEEASPAWKDRELWCTSCNEIRTDGWCERCSGPRCPSCDRCGCHVPIENPVCESCGLREPHRAAASVCRTCEADLA